MMTINNNNEKMLRQVLLFACQSSYGPVSGCDLYLFQYSSITALLLQILEKNPRLSKKNLSTMQVKALFLEKNLFCVFPLHVRSQRDNFLS